MPWRARTDRPAALRRRASRPQLKRDPLGGSSSTSMRPLAAWSLPRVLGVAFAWAGAVLLIALLTPPGRYLIWLYRTLSADGAVNVEMPVTALKVWFAVVPIAAFGPPAALLVAWLRGQGVRGGKAAV